MPKKAEPKARKRQELSSGMMRRTSLAAREGSGISGGSSAAGLGLRWRESGGGGFPAALGIGLCMFGGGGSPTPLKEKEVGVLILVLLRRAEWPGTGAGLGAPCWFGVFGSSWGAGIDVFPCFAETSNCSPSSWKGSSVSLKLVPNPSSAKGLGGYPYFRSKSCSEVFSVMDAQRSPTVASDGRVREDCPDGPRILKRIIGKREANPCQLYRDWLRIGDRGPLIKPSMIGCSRCSVTALVRKILPNIKHSRDYGR